MGKYAWRRSRPSNKSFNRAPHRKEYERIRSSNLGIAPTNPYLILGVDEDISDKDLKRAYRRMAAANHPDKLVARGVPRELMGLANHKMAVINRAYADIMARRAQLPLRGRGLPKN